MKKNAFLPSKSKEDSKKTASTNLAGISEAFAGAVNAEAAKAQSEKETRHDSWLGVEKKTIDMEACCDRKALVKKK
jgi:hypothetical protein